MRLSNFQRTVFWVDIQPLVFGDVFTQLQNVSPNLPTLKMPPIILHNPRCIAFVRFWLVKLGITWAQKIEQTIQHGIRHHPSRFRGPVAHGWLVGNRWVQKPPDLLGLVEERWLFLRMKSTMGWKSPWKTHHHSAMRGLDAKMKRHFATSSFKTLSVFNRRDIFEG